MTIQNPNARIKAFVSVLETSGASNWQSMPFTQPQLGELAEMAGHDLPEMWVTFLKSVGFPENGGWESDALRWRIEGLNAPYYCPTELEGFGTLLWMQSVIDEQVGPDVLALGLPLFAISAVSGPGFFLLLAGEESDPAVLLAPNGGQDLHSFGLVALTFSRWMEGLWLPPEFGEGWLKHSSIPKTILNTELVFGGGGATDVLMSDRLLARFDELFDSMMSVILPERGIPNVIGHEWVLNSSYQRLAEGARKHWVRPGAFSIEPYTLRSRMLTVVEMCIGVAALLEHGSGHVEDHIGCFGKGPGAELSIGEAVDALADLRVDGDLDELMLDYRYRVAVPVAAHHNYWPMDS